MFTVGDTVIHNEFGMSRITNIRSLRFPGKALQDYYEMVPLTDDIYGTTFYVAVGQENKLRSPLTREQILALINKMHETDPLEIPIDVKNRIQDVEKNKRDLQIFTEFR